MAHDWVAGRRRLGRVSPPVSVAGECAVGIPYGYDGFGIPYGYDGFGIPHGYNGFRIPHGYDGADVLTVQMPSSVVVAVLLRGGDPVLGEAGRGRLPSGDTGGDREGEIGSALDHPHARR